MRQGEVTEFTTVVDGARRAALERLIAYGTAARVTPVSP
jgi:uncharacterized protein YbjQ (UPF0145 family)